MTLAGLLAFLYPFFLLLNIWYVLIYYCYHSYWFLIIHFGGPSLQSFWLLLRVRGKLSEGFEHRSGTFWKRSFWSLCGQQKCKGYQGGSRETSYQEVIQSWHGVSRMKVFRWKEWWNSGYFTFQRSLFGEDVEQSWSLLMFHLIFFPYCYAFIELNSSFMLLSASLLSLTSDYVPCGFLTSEGRRGGWFYEST